MEIRTSYNVGQVIVIRETKTPFDIVIKINGFKVSQTKEDIIRIAYFIEYGLITAGDRPDKTISTQKVILSELALHVLLSGYEKKEILWNTK